MIVFHVINGLGTGGAERSLAELLPYLLKAGMTPVVICSHRRSEGVHRQVEQLGVEVRVLAGGGFPSRLRSLRRMIVQESPDLVHSTIFESDILSRVAALGTNTPVLTSLVCTSYNGVRLHDPRINRYKLRLAQAIDAYSARYLTSRFHAISETVRDSSVSALGISPDLVTVIERGRDPKRLGDPSSERRAATRARLGIADSEEVILNVGRQEFQKGQRYLLLAADQVLRRRPQAKFLIAGRLGNATGDLKALHGELDGRESVRFLGHRDDVPDLLCAADVFAFPSLYEGLGGSLIEAMALGVPIVASRVEAIQEVVEEGVNATLCEPGSPEALAGEIISLLEDDRRRESYARQGRERFLQRFTIEGIAERMVRLFREVAAVNGRRV